MEERDVIIVGAGPAGLSAAVFTQLDGWSTLVLEANWTGGQGAIAYQVTMCQKVDRLRGDNSSRWIDLLPNTNRRSIMTMSISEEDVHQAIGQVMHPEINRTLVELGMVKDIVWKDDEVTLTLALPFLAIPVSIKDYLVNSLRQAVMKLGAKIQIRVAEMNQEERLAFLAMEQESWKG